MPGKRKRSAKPDEEHSHITVRVENCEARIGACVNHYAYAPQYA